MFALAVRTGGRFLPPLGGELVHDVDGWEGHGVQRRVVEVEALGRAGLRNQS